MTVREANRIAYQELGRDMPPEVIARCERYADSCRPGDGDKVIEAGRERFTIEAIKKALRLLDTMSKEEVLAIADKFMRSN